MICDGRKKSCPLLNIAVDSLCPVTKPRRDLRCPGTIPARAAGALPPTAVCLAGRAPLVAVFGVESGLCCMLLSRRDLWQVGWTSVLALATLQLSPPSPWPVFTDHGVAHEKCTCVLKMRTVVLRWKIAEGSGQPEFFSFPKCIFSPQSYSETWRQCILFSVTV